MIENRWYAVLESRELPRRRPLGLERFGERLVLWRSADGIACTVDRCCHRGAALNAGVITGEDRLQCPFHGFEYDAGGRCRLIPAAGRAAEVPERYRVRAYPARESHGFIFVWWGAAEPDPPVPPFFPGLDGFRSSTLVDRWPVHYSRVIENQLDLAHLPFVHRTTIGRGNRTIVNGPRTALEGDRLRVWVDNASDRGQRPRSVVELGEPDRPPLLTFLFPNLWRNRLSERFVLIGAFVPVNASETLIYIRSYQRFVRLPPFSWLFGWITNRVNRKILNQDRRVVSTQRPIYSPPISGERRDAERLIAADRPIVLYRRRRAELLQPRQP